MSNDHKPDPWQVVALVSCLVTIALLVYGIVDAIQHLH